MKVATAPELALFGASPAFEETLHVGRPNLGSKARLLEQIDGIYERAWLTNNGPLVQEFEHRLARRLEVRNCIVTCNGTSALEIASRGLELSGEVIVPSMTFVATAHALLWQGIQPVFCDIDPMTRTIDPEKIEALITSRTTGIIGVHLWGRSCDTEAIEGLANRHGLKVLYDAAHALGCRRDGRPIGGFGDAEVFSLHATKIINSFEGGVIATDDDDLASRLRLLINFGFDGLDRVTYLGSNGKMHEASAAMGITSLESLDHFIGVNNRNMDAYRRGLEGIHGVNLLTDSPRDETNDHYVVIEVDQAKSGLSRDGLMKVLHAENIFARRYFYPGCHRMEPYLSQNPRPRTDLPVTEFTAERVLCLPTGTSVTAGDIAVICEKIGEAVECGDLIKNSLTRVSRP